MKKVPGVDNCHLLPYNPMAAYPFELRLQRAKARSDFGDCGLFGQHEFCKQVLLLCDDPKKWSIQELQANHQNLSLLTVIGVKQDYGCAKDKVTKPEFDAPPSIVPGEDMDFYDIPSLAPGAVLEKLLKKKAQRMQQEDSEGDEISQISDGAPSDIEMDDNDVGQMLEQEFASCLRIKLFVASTVRSALNLVAFARMLLERGHSNTSCRLSIVVLFLAPSRTHS